MSGTFSADNSDYPAGWYLRNPPTSGHQPYSHEGAMIFVKLWQMAVDETDHVAIDTNDTVNWQAQGDRDVCHLYSDAREQVSLQRINAGEVLFADKMTGGAELLVIEGALIEAEQTYQRGGWIRLPVDAASEIVAGANGATVYLKTGHLSQIIGADVEGR